MEMQCELLISSFNDPRTLARVKEIVGHISDGSSSHCAGMLKLGLKKAFELKKQKRQPTGVLLRCAYTICPWYGTPVAYSIIGANVNGYCQVCLNLSRGSRYLQCVGCGHIRAGVYPSCQSCGKRFI